MEEHRPQGEELFDIGMAAAEMVAMGASAPIGQIVEKVPNLVRTLEAHCPVKTAATFGALLTQKRLQSNCLRLEVLVHLSMSLGGGKRAPTQNLINQGFSLVGSVCGHLEDPPEDVFVGNIYSKRGNYRVLEGIWECATFYLQRIVNLVDSLPDEGYFKDIANSVHALLKVSDLVCDRAELQRNEMGTEDRNHSLLPSLATKFDRLRWLVKFDLNELLVHRIDLDSLEPFVFHPEQRFGLVDQVVSNTSLEASPLAINGNDLYLLLPTAVSVAIRRYFIRVLGDGDNREIFLSRLGREYARLFSEVPFFGEIGPRLAFMHQSWGSICAYAHEIDPGRYMNVVFFMDDLLDFEADGFGGVFLGSEQLHSEIRRVVRAMQNDSECRIGFKDGLTLMVGCGVGRGVVLKDIHEPRKSWAWEFVSAPNLIALGRVRGIEALDLWRIRRMEQALERNGVWLSNMNGLLNLYAWADSLGGHLVPHGQIPEALLSGEVRLLMPITQNGLLPLRHQLAQSSDEHVEPFVDGTWKLLRREGESYFEEDDRRPLYVHLGLRKQRRLLGARITGRRCWWYEALAKDGSPDCLMLDRWATMGTWIARIVDLLDVRYGASLGDGPIYWRCLFEGDPGDLEVEKFGSLDDLMDAFTLKVSPGERTIEIVVGAGFGRAIYHPHNIAEVGLMKALLRGVAELGGLQKEELEQVVSAVWADVHARHSHVFVGRTYRDFFQGEVSRSPVTISKFDDALLKLGLGWRARSPAKGGRINGKKSCLEFLHALVGQLQKELAVHLKLFGRVELLRALLLNYESACQSRDWWHKTAAAVLALREDKGAAMKAMSEHEFKLNGALLSTRSLVEMALCESPLEGVYSPGDLDVALLLAQSAQIFHLGGWADLIHWDLLEPELVVRPLGDVHARHDFMDTVMEPFGNASCEYRYSASVKKYAKSLGEVSVLENSDAINIAAEFLLAWQQEFGIHLDAYRRFIDALENHGIESGQMLFSLPRSALLKMADDPKAGATIVDSLTLMPRSEWRVPPDDYTFKDIAPWRFRRRLSLLRRPLLQVTEGDDPEFLINPGLVREGFASMVGNYYEGAYADEHLGQAMRRYAGVARQRDGQAFNELVASRMKELSWEMLPEVPITKIVGKALDRNYGDVDVLAWSPKSHRVLIMECKDLRFRRTYGEIAEQLSDYRGWASNDGKRRDSLRKHLDRVAVLRTHTKELTRFLGLQNVRTPESHLVFSYPVPMMFSSSLSNEIVITHTFDDLAKRFQP